MATVQSYANGHLREQWTNGTQSGDPTPSGYTAWDDDGTVTATRALTADESTRLAGQDAASVASSNQATIRQQAEAALAANVQDVSQDQAAITTAATISGSSGTLTAAQLSAAVRQLAQGVALLAQNDVNSKKELTALIRLALQEFDSAT